MVGAEVFFFIGAVSFTYSFIISYNNCKFHEMIMKLKSVAKISSKIMVKMSENKY